MHRIAMNVIESAISSVRQDGILLSFIFTHLGSGLKLNFGAEWHHDTGLARKNRV
jgi:hypothetical protein